MLEEFHRPFGGSDSVAHWVGLGFAKIRTNNQKCQWLVTKFGKWLTVNLPVTFFLMYRISHHINIFYMKYAVTYLRHLICDTAGTLRFSAG